MQDLTIIDSTRRRLFPQETCYNICSGSKSNPLAPILLWHERILVLKKSAHQFPLAVLAALFSVYVFWGGTYLAMRFAIETLPPFLMAGTRFLIAGLILFVIDQARGTPLPTLRQWKIAGITGALLLLGGNGSVVWAQQFVPSGLTAIIVAAVPLWMALFSWAAPGGRKPSSLATLGLLLGFGGIVLLIVGNSTAKISTDAVPWFGYATLALGSVSWSLGSLYSRRASLPVSPWSSIAMQMIAGGALLWAAGIGAGEWTALDLSHVSSRSLLAFAYLIFFGSLVGFSSYAWLLQATTPALASTYAYVNPIIAVFLGWALANEKFTVVDAIASAIIVCAVAIITFANTRTSTI